MKHIRIFALLAVVLSFAACNKDKEELHHKRDIVYTVAEETTTVHLTTEAEWDALLNQFCDYAEDGSRVTFHNANRTAKSTTKEAVTYSTTDREEMKRWMAQMEDEGMTVTVTYDPATGTWNGTAYATAPQQHDCYTGTLVEVPNPQMEEGPNLPGMVMALQINADSTLIIANGGHWFWDGYLPLSDSSAIYPGGPITLCGTVEARQDYNGDTFLQLEIGPGPQPAPTPNPVPHPNGGVLTYVCDASPMWRIIMSIDTVNNYIYATGMMYDSINTFVGYNLMVPDGFCRYNYFDPQDSGYYNYYNDRAFIFIQNLDQPSQANHYCLIGNFDFSSNGFTLEFEDYAPQDLNTVISFPFVRTDEFGLMMHRCERCDVLIHMGYGEGQSYIFPRFDGDFPFEHGKFTITAVDATASDGYGYFHEVFRLRYSITGSEPIFGTYYTDGISEDWYPLNYTTSAMWPAYFHFKKY